MEACHSAKPVLLLTVADTISAVGKDRHLLDGSKRNGRVGNSPNYVRTNIVNKGFLYSSPIARITTGSKNSSLEI